MTIESIHTLVIGAGQAGIAASEHLSDLGVAHIVLERHRIAERWRSARWDSLVTNGPAWHDRFPNKLFEVHDPNSFIGKEAVVDYLVAYAQQIDVPIRTGIAVQKVERNKGCPGFRVETTAGIFNALNLIVATGPFQNPVIPAIAPQNKDLYQIHSAEYKNPEQLPQGAVLVVGAGSSGVQIAEELQRAGRDTYLSVGAHDRPPRRYRQRDYCWWLGVLGQWDDEEVILGREHVTIAVSGAYGGYSIDFRQLALQGTKLLGVTQSFKNGVATFKPDLADNIRAGDAYLMALLDAADDYIIKNGLDLPVEPEARLLLADPDCMVNPILELNLAKANIQSIIWATGYANDYAWLQVDTLDEKGQPLHQRGVSKKERGIYFLGLPWLSRRGSAFIWGVWHDAKHIAGHIATQHAYDLYHKENSR